SAAPSPSTSLPGMWSGLVLPDACANTYRSLAVTERSMRAFCPTASSSKVVLRCDDLVIGAALHKELFEDCARGTALRPQCFSIAIRKRRRDLPPEHRLHLPIECKRVRMHGLLRAGNVHDQMERCGPFLRRIEEERQTRHRFFRRELHDQRLLVDHVS